MCDCKCCPPRCNGGIEEQQNNKETELNGSYLRQGDPKSREKIRGTRLADYLDKKQEPGH